MFAHNKSSQLFCLRFLITQQPAFHFKGIGDFKAVLVREDPLHLEVLMVKC